MENKFKKGIMDIKETGLTEGEKALMLERIFSAPEITRSPYAISFHFEKIWESKRVLWVGVPCIMVLLGGSIAFAANKSLPGDALYPVQVKAVEPILGVFRFSPAAKLQYHSELATERLREAETLVERNELDEARDEELTKLFEEHAKYLDKTTEVKAEDEHIVTDFGAGIEERANRIDEKSMNRTHTKVSSRARERAQNIRVEVESEVRGEHDVNTENDKED